MKSIKQFNISLLIRGFIIPIILLSTMIGGYRLNNKIVDLIDFGFTNKLSTLSATAGAFIDITDHDILIKPRSMTKIRHHQNDELLVLSDKGEIHYLYTDGSASLATAYSFIPNRYRVIDFDVSDNSVFILTMNEDQVSVSANYQPDSHAEIELRLQHWTTDGRFVSSTIKRGPADASIAIDKKSGNIAFGPNSNGTIQIFSDGFVLQNEINISVDRVQDIQFNNSGILTLLTSDQQLMYVHPVDADVIESKKITCSDIDDCPPIHSVTHNQDGDYWGISKSLILVNKDGTIDPEFYAHDNFHDHTSERYLDYVIPMREIREKQNLTYLYSFILNEQDKSISYVLDSSIDDDFTHIGYVDDELELDDFIAATDVQVTIKPYVSAIKPWGQWGLVKIGFAPIFGQDGTGKALMGADQNVSSISQISREALVILSLSSFVFLLFGASVSWVIANKLTAPLLVMKENVLGIAAGFLDRKILEPALDDLKPLASLFREAGNNLKNEVLQGPKVLRAFEEVRCEQDFISFLNLKIRQGTTEFIHTNIGPNAPSQVACNLNLDQGYIWVLSDQGADPSQLLTHNQIYQTADALFNTQEGVPNPLGYLFGLFESDLSFLMRLDVKNNKAHFISKSTMTIDNGMKHSLAPADLGVVRESMGNQFEIHINDLKIEIELKTRGSL